MGGLAAAQIKKLRSLRPRHTREDVFNVAMLLVDARAAYLANIEICVDAVKLYPKELKAFKLPNVDFMLLYRPEAVTAAQLQTLDGFTPVSSNMTAADKVLGRILGYTGTAFPCTQQGTVLIEWKMIVGKDFLSITEHCAKPREVKACYDAFMKIRERAKEITNVNLGGFRVDRLLFAASPFDWVVK